MEKVINIKIEKLPEGFYLATSEELQGLVAQGQTFTDTLEIAKDVAKKLIESQKEIKNRLPSVQSTDSYPLVINV